MPQFTLEQKKAHDHQRHVSITANAGSGKTSVLVSRYCDLMEYRDYEPSEVAAITFTEKAAAELRSRIAREIETRLGEETHREYWDRLKVIRDRFPAAVVTTIHGFCSQVIREFPIDLGVSPNFAVISGFERTEMEEASLMEGIEVALADEPEARFQGAYDVVRRVGREQTEVILRMMMRSRETLTLMRDDGILSRDADERLLQWRRTFDRAARSLTLNATTRPLIEYLIEHLRESKREEGEGLLLAADRAIDLEEFLEKTAALIGLLLTNDGTIRKMSFVRDEELKDVLEESAKELNRSLSGSKKMLDADPSDEVHQLLLNDTSLLLEIALEAERRYADRKGLIGGLDFEDLQLVLFEGLKLDTVRERVSGRFRYIMVDEFQDTNELQYRIVREMSRRLTDTDLLCIVGDRKQSIYGFRGAEVEVFARATREFREVNRDSGKGDLPLSYRTEQIEPDFIEEGLGEIALNASFRLLPGICAFVNATCEPLMRQFSPDRYGVEYEPLVSARNSEGTGTIEFLLSTPPDKSGPKVASEETEEITEAVLIARRIHELIESKQPVVWEPDMRDAPEVARPAGYSDIAILCRKRSTFAHLEEEFRRLDIPFLTHGSSRFFRTQEVYDVINYLRTLLNRRDDVALLGLLRSPFFAISDAELYRISSPSRDRHPESTLWERVCYWVDRSKASKPLVRAVEMLMDDLAIGSRIPVSLLLKRIVERTGWRGAVIGTERGDQMLANVDKLIDMAREFESRGFSNLFDFVERVNAQIDLEEMEAEAEINSSRDAVRLMTMHGAKGLEFPIVILPSLESPPRKSPPPFLDKELGFGWNWNFNGVDYRPMVTALMAARAVEREEAEEARLFYVALTRARDMLIISGTGVDEPTGSTMLAWAFEPIVVSEEGTGEFTVDRLMFLEEDGRTVSEKLWSQEVSIIRTLPEPETLNDQAVSDISIDQDFLQIGDLAAHARGEIYSATQFLVYTQCPTRYYLRYRLGIPESIGEVSGHGLSHWESEDGTVISRLFRKAVSEIDRISSRDDLSSLVDRVVLLEPLAEEGRPPIHSRILGMLDAILFDLESQGRIGLGARFVRAQMELRRPIAYDDSREYILGVIDRVFSAPDGSIRFVQFKTLQLAGRDPALVAEQYRPQIKLYAWLLSGLYPMQNEFIGTIFFADSPEKSKEMAFSLSDLSQAEAEFREEIKGIRAISYSASGKLPLATPHCPFCPYFVERHCLLADRHAPMSL